MATIVGGIGAIQPPSGVQDDVDDVIEYALSWIQDTVDFGGGNEINLTQAASSSNHQEYTAAASSDTVHALIVLYTDPGSTTVRTEVQLVTTSELQGLQGITAHGSGVFSIVKTSYTPGSGLTLQAGEGFAVHALTDGGTSGMGLDSLTGGGSGVSDAQASFLISAAEGQGASSTTLADISHNLKLLSKAGTTDAADIAVEVVGLVLDDTANFSQIELDYGQNTLVMANLEDMAGTMLVLGGMQKALVLGAGTVQVGDGTGSLIVGDSASQAIIGGVGNDTLVGGGGYDSLSGGAGADVFGFNRLGHYTITDFVPGVDKAYFEFDGITSLAQVKSYLTSVTENVGNVTFHFGANASITLVGVSANAVIGPLLFDV